MSAYAFKRGGRQERFPLNPNGRMLCKLPSQMSKQLFYAKRQDCVKSATSRLSQEHAHQIVAILTSLAANSTPIVARIVKQERNLFVPLIL
jgi:hypothetical protein